MLLCQLCGFRWVGVASAAPKTKFYSQAVEVVPAVEPNIEVAGQRKLKMHMESYNQMQQEICLMPERWYHNTKHVCYGDVVSGCPFCGSFSIMDDHGERENRI